MSAAFDSPVRMSVELMLGIEMGQPSGHGVTVAADHQRRRDLDDLVPAVPAIGRWQDVRADQESKKRAGILAFQRIQGFERSADPAQTPLDVGDLDVSERSKGKLAHRLAFFERGAVLLVEYVFPSRYDPQRVEIGCREGPGHRKHVSQVRRIKAAAIDRDPPRGHGATITFAPRP